MLSFVVTALCFLQTCRDINMRDYTVILIRIISDVKGRKIILLKIEKSRNESNKEIAVILISGLA